MLPSKSIAQTFSLFLILCILTSCTLPSPTTAPFTLTKTKSTISPPIPSSKSNISNTSWTSLQPGLEKRRIDIHNDQNQLTESLHILRLDQSLFRLDVAYSETPKNLQDWQKETGALIVVNGGYFRVEDEKYIPNGLTIIDGNPLGSSYEGFGGIVAINEDGAEIRWLVDQPYNPAEGLQAALQSFPMLVKPGGVLGFSAEHEDNLQARRTVIGQDKDGNLYFIVTPKGYFTLHQLSAYLIASDLHLDIALNLDGGPSSGMAIKNDVQDTIPAQSPLPVVILVYPR